MMPIRTRLFITLGSLGVATACGGSEQLGPTVPQPPLMAAVDTVRTRDIAPGVRETFRFEVAGPFAVHVLEVNLLTCGVTVRTIKAGDRYEGRETTSALMARLAGRQDRPVYGGINGDYFTSAGVVIGAQVADGEIVRAATSRPIMGVTRTNGVFFGADVFSGTVRTRNGAIVNVGRVNERPDTLRLALYNQYAGAATPDDASAVELVVQTVRRANGVGDTSRVLVTRVDTVAAGVMIPLNGSVLVGRGAAAVFLRANVAVGDTISIVLRFAGGPPSIAEVIAGDPQLLRGGRSLEPFAFAIQRDPRTAIALTADRRLLLVTVDGRLPGYSVGMTHPELTALLARLGATEALNVDGGGSTTMVLKGQVVNHPSDTAGERPVANAMAVLGPPPGTCGT